MERAITTIRLYDKTAGLRRVLLRAAPFLAVTAVSVAGMMAVDRSERIAAIAYSTCVGCSHGAGPVEFSAVSPDRPGTGGRFEQLLRLLHPDEGGEDEMAAILRE
jgi:hypothetical protein